MENSKQRQAVNLPRHPQAAWTSAQEGPWAHCVDGHEFSGYMAFTFTMNLQFRMG